jgi:hypothetical protein
MRYTEYFNKKEKYNFSLHTNPSNQYQIIASDWIQINNKRRFRYIYSPNTEKYEFEVIDGINKVKSLRPPNLPNNLEKLTKQNLEEYLPFLNKNVNPTRLDLRNCGIKTIEQNTFSDLTNIKIISLDNNLINEVSLYNAIINLNNLEYINLYGNSNKEWTLLASIKRLTISA